MALGSFSRVVLSLGVVGALAVAFGPLAREAWAGKTWERIPCYRFPNSTRFMFQYAGKVWICSRPNMWYVARSDPVPAASTALPDAPNTDCLVNRGNPPLAVLALDAHQNLAGGAGNFAAAGALLVASVGLAFFGGKKKPLPQPRTVPPEA